MKTVFDRFATRGNGGRRTGAGLGLSIVESFVSLHHGTVSIDSRPGNGTIVTCRIPSAPAAFHRRRMSDDTSPITISLEGEKDTIRLVKTWRWL